MKYIAPQYSNELAMSNDIITDSIAATQTHTNGVIENTVNVYDGEGEDKTFVGQKSSFEFSVSKFFGSNE